MLSSSSHLLFYLILQTYLVSIGNTVYLEKTKERKERRENVKLIFFTKLKTEAVYRLYIVYQENYQG